MIPRRITAVALTTALAVVLAACGDDDDHTTAPSAATSGAPATSAAGNPSSLTLVAYDSFQVGDDAFDDFTKETGIRVEVVAAGDAGAMLSKAVLTAGNPEGDVMWGVDNTLLARALAGKVFEPYRSTELADLVPGAVALAPGHEVTPVDEGDVCVNVDLAWFRDHGLTVPDSLDALIAPAYKGLLVVQNPATSSPGYAFLLATIAQHPEDWQQWWAKLRANDVLVVDGWDESYYEQFSGSSGHGPRPLVVSYGSSPPAEVLFSDPRPAQAPTAAIAATCFHQVEFAGVLRGTGHPEAAGKLVDYLVSREFQERLPLSLFVYPARTDAALPAEFEQYAVRPTDPPTVAPDQIEAHGQDWIAEWTDIVLR
jgi:thiamine transport system substrate-binding protein